VQLSKMLPGPIVLFASPMAKYFGPTIANEQQRPTSAFSILYDGYIRIVHENGSRLVARYLGIPEESPEAIIRTHALAGQMFIFLGARATILRRLGVDDLSDKNVKLIQQVIAEQTQATLLGLDLVLSRKKESEQ
jgi:TetR/AcrR family transcriptional regulator, regulator of cefoperazone and chloramphenicol sensitivity